MPSHRPRFRLPKSDTRQSIPLAIDGSPSRREVSDRTERRRRRSFTSEILLREKGYKERSSHGKVISNSSISQWGSEATISRAFVRTVNILRKRRRFFQQVLMNIRTPSWRLGETDAQQLK